MLDFMSLATVCAPDVHPTTLRALVQVESGFNPFAIGVVGASLERQPRNAAEAMATIAQLERGGYNFSVGYAQINKSNFKKYGLTPYTALNPCENLRAGSKILAACFSSARGRYSNSQDALMAAFSCYYSGNFQTGFRADFKGQPSYVQKIMNAAARNSAGAPAIPVKVASYRPQPSTDSGSTPAEQKQTSSLAEDKGRSALVY